MTWNIAAECISLVILVIIWGYSRKGSSLPSLKNKLFQGCFLVTFCAMATNILSTIMIYHYKTIPLWMTWLVTSVYFIVTPLMGMVYFLYSVSVIYSDQKSLVKIIGFGMVPGLLYAILILINPFTHTIFYLTPKAGYAKGSMISFTYLIFYAYCIASLILVVRKKSWIERRIYQILATFPIIAVLVIIFQQLYPSIILSGSAATCALLIIYLHLQNKQIFMDYLTNLPNRQELLNMMGLLTKKNLNFTILVISLRNFKHINHVFSQTTGDAFLIEVSRFFSALVRQGNVYRFSGDEFAILLRTDQEEAIRSVIHDITERMSSPWKIKDCRCIIPVSIGIVNYPNSASTLEDLVDAAEYAVVNAKSEKFGSICYCDKAMLGKLARKQQIIQILKDKLEQHSFELYYQPIVVLNTGTFQYAESLLRMNDTPLGPIYPDEFIPIAEETGLIIEITYQILDQVCKFVNHMLAKGIVLNAVHVNFSTVQFQQQELKQKILDIIEKNGTPLSAIKIEITESTISDNPQLIHDFALDMERRGIRMGMDDFGTGYSNIATVINIPFSTIKLDKSLVWASLEMERSAVAVKHLVRTFKELGLTVIAEGVETEEQNNFAKECGIDQIQGYYYARPMPPQQMEDFMLKASAPFE